MQKEIWERERQEDFKESRKDVRDLNMVTELDMIDKDAFGGSAGLEGINSKMRKAKPMKPFPTLEDVERSTKKEEAGWK